MDGLILESSNEIGGRSYGIVCDSAQQGSTNKNYIHGQDVTIVTIGYKPTDISGYNSYLSNICLGSDDSEVELTDSDLKNISGKSRLGLYNSFATGLDIEGTLYIDNSIISNSAIYNNYADTEVITLLGSNLYNVDAIKTGGNGEGIVVGANTTGRSCTLSNCLGRGRGTNIAFGTYGHGISITASNYILEKCTGESVRSDIGDTASAAVGIYIKDTCLGNIKILDCVAITDGGYDPGVSATFNIFSFIDDCEQGGIYINGLNALSRGRGIKLNNKQISGPCIYTNINVQVFDTNSTGILISRANIFINNFHVSSSTTGIDLESAATGCTFIKGTVIVSGTSVNDHGIYLRNSCKVIQCIIQVTNTSTNCLTAGAAINAVVYQNFLTGPTTKINASITINAATTETSQGNVLL
jgi:NifU-like protein involved in Fe-S cluster formation